MLMLSALGLLALGWAAWERGRVHARVFRSQQHRPTIEWCIAMGPALACV